tara:strand:+ start:184 stop:558 length:375 start_codon:yes stop_codon:yes gene_type:complete
MIIKKGIITKGEYKDWKIIIENDKEGDTGGYYLFIINANREGYDYWFKHLENLESQMLEYSIDWTKDKAGHGGSVWKQFIENSNEMNWVRDTNEYGTELPKNKCNIGKNIPIKEFSTKAQEKKK